MAIQQGWNQMTGAVQNTIRRAYGAYKRLPRKTKRSLAKRARKAVKSALKRRSRGKRSRGSKKPARLVKGSAAAKRYMAKIRRMRK